MVNKLSYIHYGKTDRQILINLSVFFYFQFKILLGNVMKQTEINANYLLRDKNIYKEYFKKIRVSVIALKYNISKNRVYQIIHKRIRIETNSKINVRLK